MIFWHLNYNIVSQHVEASEQLSQCACAGLTKAVSKLSDFTMDLCDENNSGIRDERFFFDTTHWPDKLDFVKDFPTPKV